MTRLVGDPAQRLYLGRHGASADEQARRIAAWHSVQLVRSLAQLRAQDQHERTAELLERTIDVARRWDLGQRSRLAAVGVTATATRSARLPRPTLRRTFATMPVRRQP